MKRWIWVALAAAVVGTAYGQAYRWVDENGHVGYGDTPPPGVKVTPLRVTAPAPSPASTEATQAAKGGKEANKGPLTPAEQDLEFRRRMKEAQDAAAKADKERQAAEAKKVNCENARQSLQTLDSGQRIARVDSNGERYFISDAERTEDTARAHEAVSQWCN
ncbi:MAG: DUF4124 domain-containing protein [Burkholderiales bacterium]